ncbi:hypothetical protein B0T26DRAFT_599516, partial [Lasiosphaeria miniovina]
PVPSGLAALSSRRLISVSGPDAARYLQGVITANILASPSPSPGQQPHQNAAAGFYGAFLTATGRVLHDVFIYRDTSRPDGDDGFLVEVDAAEAERLEKHIRRYKLRAKFDVRLLDPAERRVWHAWGGGSGILLSGGNDHAGTIALQDSRAPGLGYRLVTAGGSESPPEVVESTAAAAATDGLAVVDEHAYTVWRYLHGVAEGQGEMLREHALPHESNLDVMGGVDFRKGCYVGQELTIRTEHRGVVRKRILPCVLYDSSDNIPQQLSYRPTITAGGPGEEDNTASAVLAETSIGRVGKRGRSAGKWLRGAGNVGLALCRLETMTDVAPLLLPGEMAAAPGAFTPEDEFVVSTTGEEEEDGRTLRIKAFVPDWLR